MTDMTWTTLTGEKTTNGSIKRWINFDKVDPEEVIAEAEDWMALHLRTRPMQSRIETDDPLVLAEGASSIDLATDLPDFLDPISFFLVGYGKLNYIPPDMIDQRRWPDPDDLSLPEGTPCDFTVIGDTMLFDVEADAAYNIIGSYYARPTALSSGNETSIYTTKYRLIFKHALLASAYQLPKDAERQDSHFEKALALIQRQKITDDLMLRGLQQDQMVT